MLHRNRDPRILLTLLATLPFASFIFGLLIIWIYWNHWWGFGIGCASIISGFRIIPHSTKLTNSIFRACFCETLVEIELVDWVAVELEKTGTQDKFHFLPDSVAVIIRKSASFELVKLNGEVTRVDLHNWTLTNVSTSKSICAILLTNSKNIDMIGYVFSPNYKGDDLKIVCDGNLRFQWFLEWIDANSEMPQK